MHFHPGSGEDKFNHFNIDTNWKVSLDYAKKIGLGHQKYKLVEVN